MPARSCLLPVTCVSHDMADLRLGLGAMILQVVSFLPEETTPVRPGGRERPRFLMRGSALCRSPTVEQARLEPATPTLA
jgi:hypothetical protein